MAKQNSTYNVRFLAQESQKSPQLKLIPKNIQQSPYTIKFLPQQQSPQQQSPQQQSPQQQSPQQQSPQQQSPQQQSPQQQSPPILKIEITDKKSKDYIDFRNKINKICKLPLCKLSQYQDDFSCSDIIKEKMCKGNCGKHHLAKGIYYCDRCAEGNCPNLNFCIEYYNLFNPRYQNQFAKDLSTKWATHLRNCPREHDFDKVLETPINIPCGPNKAIIIIPSEEKRIHDSILDSNESKKQLFTYIVRHGVSKPPNQAISKIKTQQGPYPIEHTICLSHKLKITDSNRENHNKKGCILFKTTNTIEFDVTKAEKILPNNKKILLNIMSFNSIKMNTLQQTYWLDQLYYNMYDNLNHIASVSLGDREILSKDELIKYEDIYDKMIIKQFENDPYYNIHIMIDIFKYKTLRELNDYIYSRILNVYNIIDKIIQEKLSSIKIPLLNRDRYKLLFLSWFQDSGKELDSLYNCEDLIRFLKITNIPTPKELYRSVLSVPTPSLLQNDSPYKLNIQLQDTLVKIITNINKFTKNTEKLKKWINNLSVELDNNVFNLMNIEDIVDDSLIRLQKIYNEKNMIMTKIKNEDYEIKNIIKNPNFAEVILKFKDTKYINNFEKPQYIDDKTSKELEKLFEFKINDDSFGAKIIRYIYNTEVSDTQRFVKLKDLGIFEMKHINYIKNLLIMVQKKINDTTKLVQIDEKIEEVFTNFMKNYFTSNKTLKEKKEHDITAFSDKSLESLKEITDSVYKTFLIMDKFGIEHKSIAYAGLKPSSKSQKSRLSLSQLTYGIKEKFKVLKKILNGDIRDDGSIVFALKVLFEDNDMIIYDYLVLDSQNTINNLIKAIQAIQNRLYRMNKIEEILNSLAYTIRIFKIILNFSYNPNKPEYNDQYYNQIFGNYINLHIREYINIFFNSCSDELLAKISKGEMIEGHIKVIVSLDLSRPQMEFNSDEMNFHATGVILDKFKEHFTPIIKQEYETKEESSYKIENNRLIIKTPLEINLYALHNIYLNFTKTPLSYPSFLRFDLNEYKTKDISTVLESKFPVLSSLKKSKQKYIKYKTKYLALKSLIV
jgi:hypothetical protein